MKKWRRWNATIPDRETFDQVCLGVVQFQGKVKLKGLVPAEYPVVIEVRLPNTVPAEVWLRIAVQQVE